MKDLYFLFRSDKPAKKFVMVMPSHKHLHYFGATGYRDFTLMNDKNSKFYEEKEMEREKVRRNYINRHKKEPKGEHTPSSMSDLILWSKPTLAGGIKKYEEMFEVRVKFKDKKLSEKLKNQLLAK
jgi:hypothetical protein